MDRGFLRVLENGSRAQATVEMAIALVLSMVLLVGAAKIFVWLNGRMATRQRIYEETRVNAASEPMTGWGPDRIPNTGDDYRDARIIESQDLTVGPIMDESDYPALNIFHND